MLRGVGEHLGHDVVGRHLDRFGKPPGYAHVHHHRDGRAPGECAQCGAQPALGQGRRVDAAGESSQVVEHAAQLTGDVLDLGAGLGRKGGHLDHHAQSQHQRDEELLRAVVQVALDPSPGLVRRRHEPRAGGQQLGPVLLVGDRRRHELREACQPLGGVGWRSRLLRRDGDQPPQQAVDDHRSGGREPPLVGRGGEPPGAQDGGGEPGREAAIPIMRG